MHAFHYRRMENSFLGQAICQIQSRAVLACIVRGPTMLLEQEVFHMVNFAKSKNSDGEVWDMLLALKKILGLFQHRLRQWCGSRSSVWVSCAWRRGVPPGTCPSLEVPRAGAGKGSRLCPQSPLPLFTTVPIHLQITEEATLGNCPPAFKEEVAFHTFIFFSNYRKGSLGCWWGNQSPIPFLISPSQSHLSSFWNLKAFGNSQPPPPLPFLSPYYLFAGQSWDGPVEQKQDPGWPMEGEGGVGREELVQTQTSFPCWPRVGCSWHHLGSFSEVPGAGVTH